MSALMSSSSFCIDGLSCPAPMISKACTSGMPAPSMVASWRLKIAMSPALTLPPERVRRGLLLDAGGGDALAAQFAAHRLLVLRHGAALDLLTLAITPFPVEGHVTLDGCGLRC